MTSFHQMAHDSQNLLEARGVSGFAGAIVSPVNYTEAETASHIHDHQDASPLGFPADFSFILDPQLYYPTSERWKLKTWPYYPSDFDTSDLSSLEYWCELNLKVIACSERLGVRFACSPTAYAKRFTPEQYKFVIDVGSDFARASRGKNFTPMQSVIVNMAAVNDARAALALASIISATECPWVYLMFRSENQDPRRELAEADELLGAMHLISALERADIRVMVAYSSSDLVLWKAAGATASATGKFFNVRRFTKSRFDPPKSGGGNLPYWFEESLLAFLRQGDLLKLDKAGLLSAASKQNHFYLQVITRARANKPWKAQSFRQFMHWFADAEARLHAGMVTARHLIETAQANWQKVHEQKLYPEEPENRGAWLQQWLDALDHFEGRKSGTDSAA